MGLREPREILIRFSAYLAVAFISGLQDTSHSIDLWVQLRIGVDYGAIRMLGALD